MTDTIASSQSEQLPFFKDYYSQDDIRPGDKVSVLWYYFPRAGDEFKLERGDMLEIVGLWDDGWGTAVRLDERAENFEFNKAYGGQSIFPSSEIKAFPVSSSHRSSSNCLLTMTISARVRVSTSALEENNRRRHFRL